MDFLKQLAFYFGLALALVGTIASIPGGIVEDLGKWIISLVRSDEESEEE